MIKKDNEMFLNLAEAAQIMGVSRGKFEYLIRKGFVTKPASVIGKRHYYGELEMKQVEKQFEKLNGNLLTIKGTAKYYGMPVVTL